jgi:hypothetical protein
MAEVKILVEGYTIEDSKKWGQEETCPTITLVKDENLTIIVDLGVLKNKQILVDELEEEGLRVDDVDIVCVSLITLLCQRVWQREEKKRGSF